MSVALFLLLSVATALAAPSNNGRLAGGEIAKDGQFPAQASLRFSGYHRCGAIIIDKDTLLTAALCFEEKGPRNYFVQVGTNKLQPTIDSYPVRDYVVHENYDVDHVTDNIAIIKLGKSLVFNDKIQPAKLGTDVVGGGKNVITAGWGITSQNGSHPEDLKLLKLKTLSFEECNEKLEPANWYVIESDLCTFTQAGEGICNGDPGGVLVDSKGTLVGISSYGSRCGGGYPDVHVRISSYLDWIEKNRHF